MYTRYFCFPHILGFGDGKRQLFSHGRRHIFESFMCCLRANRRCQSISLIGKKNQKKMFEGRFVVAKVEIWGSGKFLDVLTSFDLETGAKAQE